MIHDSTPSRVLKIGELARLIAGELVITSQQGAVGLACACRCLEEPVLSKLWETQERLNNLLETLPQETWDYERPPSGRVVRDLNPPSGESDA